jgi:hypothetical protein
MIDIKTLLKILTEWGFNSKNYYLVHAIYSNFNVGIPIKFIYKLPKRNHFESLNAFIDTNEILSKTDDIYLQEIFEMFKKSKYKKLPVWGRYGYSKI